MNPQTDYPIPHQLAKDLADRIEEAVRPIIEAHDPPLQYVRGKFGYGIGFTFTVKASPIEEGPNGVNLATPEAQAFTANASIYGIDPDALGKTFDMGKVIHTITGFRSGARVRPISTSASNGKGYVWPARDIARLFPLPAKDTSDPVGTAFHVDEPAVDVFPGANGRR